ncbi:MAG: AAA family ATPase [Clostridiaceae bacterium]|nr:AAA family ATPase [Clostridiaceae bacterium]
MDAMNNTNNEEHKYLSEIIELLNRLIEAETKKLINRKKELIDSRKNMWEESVHFSNDFDRLIEMNQHAQQVQSRTIDYESSKNRIDKYNGLLEAPYFGRIDFTEEGYSLKEKIYIGKSNVINPSDNSIAIYDWRAPISSLFYRFEPGPSYFTAPVGEIHGEISLKRQYKIVKSRLVYYFDCNLQISDEILQEVLGRNSSPVMRTIIETIQREQDIIIRDTESDLLIVQGVAGSGKTSIALHRIAFLMYEGMTSKLSSNNILIMSPNNAFGNYIGHVLPELGEENIENSTLESIIKDYLASELSTRIYRFRNRDKLLEECIAGRSDTDGETVAGWVQFKGSAAFKTILDRYLDYYERKIIKFDDVYYNNKVIFNSQELKGEFLYNKTGMPMAKRLSRIENRIFEAIGNLRKKRLGNLEKITAQSDGHEFEVKSHARRMLMKNSEAFSQRLGRTTRIDVIDMYEGLFRSSGLFLKLSEELELPQDIEKMIEHTVKGFKNRIINYEDWTAIAYLKIKAFGADSNSDIRQVVIDEVQDYYPLQFAIIRELYKDAKYTVVGDIAQSIERKGELSIYDEIPVVLEKKKTVKLSLLRSYRSSYEINEFAKQIAGGMEDCISFPRHEKEPEIVEASSKEELESFMLDRIGSYFKDGFERIAILCKTFFQAKSIYQSLKAKTDIKLTLGGEFEDDRVCLVMPVYAAKGLEFDAVLVYEVDDSQYNTELDKRLLYIACTRALHRLSLFYEGQRSRYLSCESQPD